MKVFNTDFRGDMTDNYELFGAELPVWFFVLVGLAELQQLDAWIGGIVSGTFRRLSRGDRENYRGRPRWVERVRQVRPQRCREHPCEIDWEG